MKTIVLTLAASAAILTGASVVVASGRTSVFAGTSAQANAASNVDLSSLVAYGIPPPGCPPVCPPPCNPDCGQTAGPIRKPKKK